MSRISLGIVTTTAVGALFATALSAAELPKTHVTGVGLNKNTVASSVDEVPFWSKTVPEASAGRVTATFAPMDVMGVKGHQVMRMTKLGVVDFGSSDVSKMAVDDPVFEGCDLAGLTLDIETARAACEAWFPTMAKAAEELFNVKMLALGANPPQVIWCRDKIVGFKDLTGRKVRVFNKTMTDFMQAVGATAVRMPFAEVVPALRSGIVDCAVTGNLSGNTAGWPEITTHQYQAFMGWGINYQSVNLDSWHRFTPEVRTFFLEQFAALEDRMWETAAAAAADADDCNFGGDKCELGEPAATPLTNVPVSEADKQLHEKLMQEVVLVAWGRRAGKARAREWNETVGKIVGLSIPLDKI